MEKKVTFTATEATAIKMLAVDSTLKCLRKQSDRPNADYYDAYIGEMIDDWFNNNESAICRIIQHPLYDANEPFKIVRKIDVKRDYDKFSAAHFINYLYDVQKEYAGCVPIDFLLSKVREFLRIAAINESAFITESDLAAAERLGIQPMPVVGQKLSKYIRKLFTSLGFRFLSRAELVSKFGDKTETWFGKDELIISELEFARFADGVNPQTFKRTFVFSVDPVDYLMLSHGKSWSSCYCINKNWRGETYQGLYSSGCWSYMTDGCSFVTYMVDDDVTADFANAPKVYRQIAMVDWESGVLLNSRLYPQSNDDHNSKTAYDNMRNCCQAIVSELMDAPNYWVKISSNNQRYFVESKDFVGYNDVHYFHDKVTISYNKSVAETETDESTGKKYPKMQPKEFGGKAICPSCGDRLFNGRYICGNCATETHCESCGCGLTESDFENGYGVWGYDRLGNRVAICENCSFYCEYCHEWYVYDDCNGDTVRDGDCEEWWCDDCIEHNAFYCEVHEQYEADCCHAEVTVRDKKGYFITCCVEGAIESGCWECYNCGEWFTDDVAPAKETRDGEFYCKDCVGDDDDDDDDEM